MPRKKVSNAARHKPSAPPHPSLAASGSSDSTTHSQSELSVNRLLADLRSGPPPVTPSSHRSNAKDSGSSTLTALVLPPSNAPPERPLSPRSRMAERRRARGPPGPRAPPSWSRPVPLVGGLEASVHASTKRRRALATSPSEDGTGRGTIWSVSQVPMLPHLPLSTSLQMIVLARMARHWSWHAANDLDWLGVLPVPVRESLLWVLADHGQALDKEAMQALIAGLADGISAGPDKGTASAPDSWETPTDVPDAIRRLAIGPSLTTSRAYRWLGDVLAGPGVGEGLPALQVNLTHLSLVATPAPSWTRLVALAPSLPHLIHLDLAGWPSPESLSGGGGVPSDPQEDSARTLKRLGRALSGLQWLGLDGCAEWMGAWFAGLDTTPSTEAGTWSAWDDDGTSAEKEPEQHPHPASSSSSDSRLPPVGHVDWPRAFYSLRTLRLSMAPNATLSALLESEEAWKSAVATYTNTPSDPFPPLSPHALLRVPESHPPARDYEGPRWERTPERSSTVTDGLQGLQLGHATPRTAYTLQAAHRLPAYRAVTAWLGAAHAMADLEARVRRVRRAYSDSSGAAASSSTTTKATTTTTPFSVHRSGIDDPDTPIWIKDLVERWTARRKRAGYHPSIATLVT